MARARDTVARFPAAKTVPRRALSRAKTCLVTLLFLHGLDLGASFQGDEAGRMNYRGWRPGDFGPNPRIPKPRRRTREEREGIGSSATTTQDFPQLDLTSWSGFASRVWAGWDGLVSTAERVQACSNSLSRARSLTASSRSFLSFSGCDRRCQIGGED
eukprot:1205932-Rhodomonas_salina.2